VSTDSPIHGLVLAGGTSSRMRRDKAALLYRGRTQLDRAIELAARHVDRVFVSVRAAQTADPARARYPLIADSVPGQGPIVGIRSALSADPVAAWRDLSGNQARLVKRLSAASEIRIQAEGTDVRLGVAGRTWVNSDGRRNMPSGEVFTGPHERSANGTIRFTVPTGPRGVTVTGVLVPVSTASEELGARVPAIVSFVRAR